MMTYTSTYSQVLVHTSMQLVFAFTMPIYIHCHTTRSFVWLVPSMNIVLTVLNKTICASSTDIMQYLNFRTYQEKSQYV